MTLPALFYSGVLLWAASLPPVAAVAETCVERGPTEATIDGWPVLVAFKMSPMKGGTFQLGLSRRHHTHTNLTLTYQDKFGDVLLVEVLVEIEKAQTSTTRLLLLTPNIWNTLRLNFHKNKLVLMVAEVGFNLNYTTRALLDFPHHRGVDTVTSKCSSPCLAEVDLQCLYDTGKETSEPPMTERETTEGQGTPGWPFFMVFILLLLVCILYLAWRYQRNQIKLRRRLQAETEAAMKRSSQRRPRTGSPRASSEENQDTRQESEGHQVADRVQYSTILMSYDGPCSGDDDDSLTFRNFTLPTSNRSENSVFKPTSDTWCDKVLLTPK